MLLTKASLLSGRTTTREIGLSERELEAYYESDELIQRMYPHLSPEDREFVMTGITPEEWNRFREESDDEDDEEKEAI